MADLTTRYLGFALRSPLVASASPLTGNIDMLRALEAAGVAAVVLPSLFEEQVAHPSGDVATLDDYNTGPHRYLRLIEAAKSKLEAPVIASLNGTTPGGWTRYARLMEEAGADAIELNLYRIVGDPDASPRAVEQEYVDVVAAVRDVVRVPLAVKVGPFFTAFANFATRLTAAGADGLVLFNRFYQPDIDLQHLSITTEVVLSDPAEARLPLRWLALLHGRVDASLAATTGIATAAEVIKALLVGADVTMLASALLRGGPDVVTTIEDELANWMHVRGFASVAQLQGRVSLIGAADPSGSERTSYLQTLTTYASPLLP